MSDGSLTRALERKWGRIERRYRQSLDAYDLCQTPKRYRGKRRAERRWIRALRRIGRARKMGW